MQLTTLQILYLTLLRFFDAVNIKIVEKSSCSQLSTWWIVTKGTFFNVKKKRPVNQKFEIAQVEKTEFPVHIKVLIVASTALSLSLWLTICLCTLSFCLIRRQMHYTALFIYTVCRRTSAEKRENTISMWFHIVTKQKCFKRITAMEPNNGKCEWL